MLYAFYSHKSALWGKYLHIFGGGHGKVEKVLKGSLDSIPSLSVKIQIMGGKVCLSNVLPYYLK